MWRELILPLLTRREVEALLNEVRDNDGKRLTRVEILTSDNIGDVVKADPIAFCMWKGRGVQGRDKIMELCCIFADAVRENSKDAVNLRFTDFWEWYETESWGKVLEDLREELEHDLRTHFARHRLYHWYGVLECYNGGNAVALATCVQEARELVLKDLKDHVNKSSLFTEVPHDDPVWDGDKGDDLHIPDYWYESRAIVSGPPTAVYDTPVALCFRGSD